MDDSNARSTRLHIGLVVQRLRTLSGWSQSDLAEKLDVSQPRLSRIERGDSSLKAEEFLELLTLFNVSLDLFRPSLDRQASLQNALARHGAFHLREDPRVPVVQDHESPSDVVVAVLVDPASERLVTALAPVVVRNIDGLSLPSLQRELRAVGTPHRLGWLAANVLAALDNDEIGGPLEWRQVCARTQTVLSEFLKRLQRPEADESWDPFDPGIRTPTAQQKTRQEASGISKEWKIESHLRPTDFQEALAQARKMGSEFLDARLQGAFRKHLPLHDGRRALRHALVDGQTAADSRHLVVAEGSDRDDGPHD